MGGAFHNERQWALEIDVDENAIGIGPPQPEEVGNHAHQPSAFTKPSHAPRARLGASSRCKSVGGDLQVGSLGLAKIPQGQATTHCKLSASAFVAPAMNFW